MKRFYSPRRHSFTLVELLVVMGIIAILAAVLLSSVTGALRMANRAKASVLANQIQTACMNYYADYSLYPVPTAASADVLYADGSANLTQWETLTYVLCGNINPYLGTVVTAPAVGPANQRSTVYLTLNRNDVDANGVPKNPLPAVAANPYFNIAFDADYDGLIGNPAATNPNIAAQPINFSTSTPTSIKNSALAAGVAVWANCNTSTTTTNLNYYVHTY